MISGEKPVRSLAASGPPGTPGEDERKGVPVKYPRWGMPVVAVLVVVFAFGMCILAWALQKQSTSHMLLYAQLSIAGSTLAISSAFVLVIIAGIMSRRPSPAGTPSREHSG